MSAKTKSERLRRLVSHGYFAPELPPCFVSESLAKYRGAILAGIDALQATGAISLRQIAAALNDLGVATARGKEWQAMTVKNLLSRAA